MCADAVVFKGAREIDITRLELEEPSTDDVVVDVVWSGVSTGTERLLWSGEMPPFPGLGYPLVPGYEAIGDVVWAGERADLLGKRVFVPGSRCFKGAYGLFGAAASRLVAPSARVAPVDIEPGEEGVLLALAATAYHAIAGGGDPAKAAPDLIIGHGVLGRLLARITLALGAPTPVVWEIDPERADADGYPVIEPDCDGRSDYNRIFDVSGDPAILDQALGVLAPRGEIVLAGFYSKRLGFNFPPAFLKEARMRVAAEWAPDDLRAVLELVRADTLSLHGLITHLVDVGAAGPGYRTAFEDPSCLKMVLDWRAHRG